MTNGTAILLCSGKCYGNPDTAGSSIAGLPNGVSVYLGSTVYNKPNL